MLANECKAGQRVYVLENTADWYNKAQGFLSTAYDRARTTTIIGITFTTQARSLGSSVRNIIVYKPSNLGGYNVIDTDNHFPDGWRVSPENLKLLKELPKINPYPNQCKTCNAPARKVNKITLCSRDKCKSKNQIKKYGKPVSISGLDSDNYPICPLCFGRVATFGATIEDLLCDNDGHTWKHTWLDGQRLATISKQSYIYKNGQFIITN